MTEQTPSTFDCTRCKDSGFITREVPAVLMNIEGVTDGVILDVDYCPCGALNKKIWGDFYETEPQ